jgi:adenosylcobinamide-GDP ribazoletransferase
MPWDGLRRAVTLLTAVPLPPGRSGADAAGRPTARQAAAVMYWAPVIGLVLGAIAAGVLELASRLGRSGPLLAAVLAIAALALLTRGLHLDGLADLADGLGSRRPAAAALQIMRQSDIGPFGVVTLVLTLLIQVAALARAAQAGRGGGAVIAAAVAARLAMTLACRRGIPASRGSGLGAGMAGSVHPLAAAALIAAGLAGAAWADWRLAAGMAAGLAVSLALTALAVRRLGGVTGDVLGAVAELTGAACLLVIALS